MMRVEIMDWKTRKRNFNKKIKKDIRYKMIIEKLNIIIRYYIIIIKNNNKMNESKLQKKNVPRIIK
jgi:hypothetical protein